MGGAMVVAVVRARWCGGGAGYGAQASTDRRTDAGTVPAASNCSDYSPSAGAEQAATDRALAGIVRVSEGRRRQQIQHRSRWLQSIAFSFASYQQAHG